MSRFFECSMCTTFCRLEADEDDVELPHACPWLHVVPTWVEVSP